MTFHRSAALTALLAATPAVLAAQDAADARSVSFHLAAGGAAPLGGALDAFDPGWAVAGAARLRLHPALAVRLEAQHARVAGDAFTVPGPADEPVRIEPRLAITAVTVAAEFAPWRFGAVRPYAVVGGGYHHLRSRDATDQMDVVITDGDATSAFGVVYGGGLAATLGRITPFVEVRQHIVFERPDNLSFVPVVVGVRF